jgi:NADP-reducing hydrogenase subunit HndC
MYEILTRIVEGQGTPADLELLEEVAEWVKAASLCGLGQTAPNPVLSTLRYFRDEYEAHVTEKRCPAGVCRALIQLIIHPDLCNGCGLCRRECPAGAIIGEQKEPHAIDVELCTRCRICYDICPLGAIEIVR